MTFGTILKPAISLFLYNQTLRRCDKLITHIVCVKLKERNAVNIQKAQDVMMSMQDLYVSNVNLRLNEVMKVMTIVTCLLAPATVIGGVFGMNFDVIPYAHHQWGFYFAVAGMLLVPLVMLYIFKRRGWF